MSKKRDPEESILEYLQQQNRPYSAVDVFNNLHKEFGKTAVIKALELLSEKERIIEKTYGKQKVYAPSQEQYSGYDQNELKKLDANIVELQEEINTFQQHVKKQDSEIHVFSNQIKTEDALENIESLKRKNEILSQRIQKLKSGTTLMTKEERKNLYLKKDKMLLQWRKRKRITNDIINSILEGYPKSKKQLLEDIGIETDEEIGVQLPK